MVMSKINGISLRNIRDFVGHEGEPLCQGDLYLNDQRIGFWSHDSWGGPDNVRLDPQYSLSLLNKAIISLNKDKAYVGGSGDNVFVLEYDLERLMGDYLDLTYDEKALKDAFKKGYAGVIIASSINRTSLWYARVL